MTASDYRTRARQALTGKWGTAVLVGLVASVLGGANVNYNFSSNSSDLSDNMEMVLEQMPYEVVALFLAMVGIIGVFTLVYSVVSMILGSVVQLGYIRFNLNLIDGKEGKLGDLFTCFRQFLNALLLRIFMGLIIGLLSLLFIIPGVMAGCALAMAPYIMAEDPNCSAMQAISRSMEMTEGHKMELFLLRLSFIGWGLLSLLTFGIGNLFLTPYMNAADAAFYRNLQSSIQEGCYLNQGNQYPEI